MFFLDGTWSWISLGHVTYMHSCKEPRRDAVVVLSKRIKMQPVHCVTRCFVWVREEFLAPLHLAGQSRNADKPPELLECFARRVKRERPASLISNPEPIAQPVIIKIKQQRSSVFTITLLFHKVNVWQNSSRATLPTEMILIIEPHSIKCPSDM